MMQWRQHILLIEKSILNRMFSNLTFPTPFVCLVPFTGGNKEVKNLEVNLIGNSLPLCFAVELLRDETFPFTCHCEWRKMQLSTWRCSALRWR
jgi:hypothetical protein